MGHRCSHRWRPASSGTSASLLSPYYFTLRRLSLTLDLARVFLFCNFCHSYHALTLGFYVGSLVLSLVLTDLGMVLDVMGATVGVFFIFFVPALLILRKSNPDSESVPQVIKAHAVEQGAISMDLVPDDVKKRQGCMKCQAYSIMAFAVCLSTVTLVVLFVPMDTHT